MSSLSQVSVIAMISGVCSLIMHCSSLLWSSHFILRAFNTIVFKELILKSRLLLVAFGVDDAVGECITEILASELDTLVFKSSKLLVVLVSIELDKHCCSYMLMIN